MKRDAMEILVYGPYKIQNLDRNWMKMQTPTPAKIWNLDFGKIRFPEKYEIGTSKSEIRLRIRHLGS